MASTDYEQTLQHAEQLDKEELVQLIAHLLKPLSPDEQLSVITSVLELIRRQPRPAGPRRSILELEGLGKEIWEGIDAQEYVDKERGKCSG
jgi:hypothetical protein